MHLTQQISPDQNLLDLFSQQLGVPVVANRLAYTGPLGNYLLRGYFFPNDLSLYVYESITRLPLSMETINPADSGLYCVFINLSEEELPKNIQDTTVWLSNHSADGIFFYGPGVRISQQIPQHRPITAVCITFSADTFADLLPQPTTALPEHGGFAFLEVDLDTDRLLRQLAAPEPDESLATLKKYPLALALAVRVFEKMQQRQSNESAQGLLQPDVEQLFKVRAHLLANLNRPVPVSELTELAGFSEAKLRKYFPRLFGCNIHQFWQTARMERAKELLTSRRYSVSEVGFLVGYTNLTHFTNAYKKHFDHKPSDYLRQVRDRSVLG